LQAEAERAQAEAERAQAEAERERQARLDLERRLVRARKQIAALAGAPRRAFPRQKALLYIERYRV
jgi:hypothetical protein